MRIFLPNEPLPIFRNAVITIGTFDGVHCGHQQIIKHLKKVAEQYQGETVLITFEPHPRDVFLFSFVQLAESANNVS